MECPRWEEIGLLFTADELDPKEKSDYEEHLRSCAVCRDEMHAYEEERQRFFTPEILCETPSPEIDREILRVCSDARKKVTSHGLLPIALLRKAIIPVMLIVIGFTGVSYVTLNIQNAKQTKFLAARQHRANDAVPAAVLASTRSGDKKAADSAIDSMHNSNQEMNFARSRGNLNDKGVVAVDLKK